MLKHEITTQLNARDKLLSIRKISQEYKVSRNTVESAYSQLYAEGYIESKPRSGYYVSNINNQPLEKIDLITTKQISKVLFKYDFFPARLSQSSFPPKLWKRLFTKAVNETVDFGSYPDGQGEYSLRCEIARYLTVSRTVVYDPAQIVIRGAFVDSITMIADILQDTHHSFAIENPGYMVTRTVFERFNYDISSIDVDENGIKVNDLINSNANIVYITPSHQYPTGVTMPIANRFMRTFRVSLS